VCLEAYQRTVDVKKQCFRHNVPFDSVTKVKKILIFAEYKDINYGIDNRNHPIH
jgi:sporulation protein YlmC with PRC-barrel domain